MKVLKHTTIIFLIATMLSGCASYRARGLTALEPVFVKEHKQVEGVKIGCKEFSEKDCKKYLDRDLIKMGYQPVQLTFYNGGKENYYFSDKNISLPLATKEEIYDVMRTSTVGRSLGYAGGAIGSALIVPLALVPVVGIPFAILGVYMGPTLLVSGACDGVMSYSSNEKLEVDLSDKMKEEFYIAPGCYYQTVVFVKKDSYKKDFDLALLDGDSGENKILHLQAIK